jgi:hypothetical protein
MIIILVGTLLYLVISCNIEFIWEVKYRGLRLHISSSAFSFWYRGIHRCVPGYVPQRVRGLVRVLTFGAEVGVNLSFGLFRKCRSWHLK